MFTHLSSCIDWWGRMYFSWNVQNPVNWRILSPSRSSCEPGGERPSWPSRTSSPRLWELCDIHLQRWHEIHNLLGFRTFHGLDQEAGLLPLREVVTCSVKGWREKLVKVIPFQWMPWEVWKVQSELTAPGWPWRLWKRWACDDPVSPISSGISGFVESGSNVRFVESGSNVRFVLDARLSDCHDTWFTEGGCLIEEGCDFLLKPAAVLLKLTDRGIWDIDQGIVFSLEALSVQVISQ